MIQETFGAGARVARSYLTSLALSIQEIYEEQKEYRDHSQTGGPEALECARPVQRLAEDVTATLNLALKASGLDEA